MMNIMRADMYRLLRGKTVYIMLAIMLVLVGFTVFVFRAAPQTGMIVISSEESIDDEALGGLGEILNEFMIGDAAEVMSGAVAAQIALSSMDVLVYFILAVIIIVAMANFSCGTIKNDIATGVGRVNLYFSKFLLSFILSVGLMLLYFFMTVAFALMVDGVGYWGNGFVLEVLASFGAQMVLVLAINSFGLFLGFVLRNDSAIGWIYLAILFVPALILHLLSLAVPSALDLLRFDIITQFEYLSQITNITFAEAVRSFVICAILIFVPTIAGISIFKRAEIK